MACYQIIVSILCLLIFCTASTLSKHKTAPPKPPVNCGKKYTDINGTIHAYKNGDTAPAVVCSFYVNYNNSNTTLDPDHKVFLVFEDVLLGDDDTVTILTNDKPLKFFQGSTLSNVSGTFSVLTGQSNITIVVDPTHSTEFQFTKTFKVYYYSNSECAHTFDKAKSGIVHSPLYDHDEATFPIQCYFKFAVPDKDNHYMNLWFEPFIFNKGEISIDGALSNNNKYDSTPPVEFLVKDILELNVTISNSTSVPEIFIVKYDSVTKPTKDNACSGVKTVTISGDATLTTLNSEALRHILSTQDKNLNCLWLIDTEVGHTITLTVSDKTNLPQKLDSLLVLDGANRSSNVLLDLNFEHKPNERVLYSSGQYLWILASSPFVNEHFYVELKVSQTTSGGHLFKNGTVSAKEDQTTYLLEVDPGMQVKFVPDWQSTRLQPGSSVSFYKDFSKTSDVFMKLDPDHLADAIVSPTEKMAIVTSGFDKSDLEGSFYGIDQGCYKYGEGSGDTFSVTGHCNSTCAWIVQPNPATKDHLAFHFQTMSLYPTDRVLIRKLDSDQTLVANISLPKSHFPDLWLPAETGAFVQVTRSSCPSENTVIQSSYQISSGCGTDLTPGINEMVEISSPGYPGHYPLGATCTWTIAKPPNAAFMHVSFKDLQLAQENHTVHVFSGTGIKLTPVFMSNYTHKELPDDIPIFDSLTVTFVTDVEMPQESLPGFKMEVVVVGRGGVLRGSTGKVETPSFPQVVSDNLLSVWLVTTNSTDDQKQILQYEFDNRTDLVSIEGLLKIYDGASIHSPLASNLTNDTALSRTNSLLFVYQNTMNTSQPGFSLTYYTHECNMSMLCDNGICMHDDWFCNEINDCGDYSDERNCEGEWPPGPQPPTPSPKENVSGASVGVLTGSIIAGFAVGVIIAVLIPFGYRYWRSRRMSAYAAVNS